MQQKSYKSRSNGVKSMNFEFDIGQTEKHHIKFSYSRIWGTKSIRVDNQIVKRRRLPFLLIILVVILTVILMYFQSLQWPDYQTNILEIYFFLLIFGYIDVVIALLPMKVIVGENEKFSVKIQWIWKPFPFYRSSKFKVYLNNYFFKAFEGESLIEYVDEKIDFH